jgi:hypothetical protein
MIIRPFGVLGGRYRVGSPGVVAYWLGWTAAVMTIVADAVLRSRGLVYEGLATLIGVAVSSSLMVFVVTSGVRLDK